MPALLYCKSVQDACGELVRITLLKVRRDAFLNFRNQERLKYLLRKRISYLRESN